MVSSLDPSHTSHPIPDSPVPSLPDTALLVQRRSTEVRDKLDATLSKAHLALESDGNGGGGGGGHASSTRGIEVVFVTFEDQVRGDLSEGM